MRHQINTGRARPRGYHDAMPTDPKEVMRRAADAIKRAQHELVTGSLLVEAEHRAGDVVLRWRPDENAKGAPFTLMCAWRGAPERPLLQQTTEAQLVALAELPGLVAAVRDAFDRRARAAGLLHDRLTGQLPRGED